MRNQTRNYFASLFVPQPTKELRPFGLTCTARLMMFAKSDAKLVLLGTTATFTSIKKSKNGAFLTLCAAILTFDKPLCR